MIEENIPIRLKSEHYVAPEEPARIMEEYKNKLEHIGYKIFKELEGIEEYNGYTIHYAVYLKGITIYAIAATSVNVVSELLPDTCVYIGVGSILGVNPNEIDTSIFTP